MSVNALILYIMCFMCHLSRVQSGTRDSLEQQQTGEVFPVVTFAAIQNSKGVKSLFFNIALKNLKSTPAHGIFNVLFLLH